ncbi:hypothetical protein IKE96_02655, partial [bacterium]|nr:hypothetical protein [bacterium]
MWSNFSEYILSQCNKNPTKIAEIGVGKFNGVYEFLNSQYNVQIIKTDIQPAGEDVIEDDITKPNLDIYTDIDILYSIRPPSEIQPYLIDLALKIDSQLIIKPLFNEDLNVGNHKM